MKYVDAGKLKIGDVVVVLKTDKSLQIKDVVKVKDSKKKKMYFLLSDGNLYSNTELK